MRSRNDSGFTLIELIVVIAIIIILSGSVLATYFNFSQRQAVVNDARSFLTVLRQVQSMAKNLVYPPEVCTGLTAYRLESQQDEQSVTASAVCSENEYPVLEINNKTVLTKAFFQDQVDIRFMAGSGSINREAVGTYYLRDDVGLTSQFGVKVDENGAISLVEISVTPTPTVTATPTPTPTPTPTVTPRPTVRPTISIYD